MSQMMASQHCSDEYYMARAIMLAKKGWYSTHPNPRVGCVLVRDNQIIAQGWHEYAGQAHAEVNALANLSSPDKARGATAYVTLEPCSHFGKTPPCSDALIAAGVKRVVAAMVDPNPLVAGNGLKRLQDHGIETKSGVLEAEARALNPGFIRRMASQRPNIRCKMAMSLDGRTAMASGESKWITSDAAREDVQRLRAESSAILTGIGTVLADDPAMNVRSQRFAPVMRQPERMILDTQLRMPADAKMLALNGQTVICTAHETVTEAASLLAEKRQALESLGACLYQLNTELHNGRRQLVLSEVISVMAQRQYNDVLLEAGASLTGSMLQAGYVDELIIYMAPHLMGSEARGLFHLPGLNTMRERFNLNISDIRAVGKDFRITAAVNSTTESSPV
jgi:diaminohydroxyphosphoribosylaminopyrimidine deaminase/5-amino-6-(5-phosphoribosylamino)uracil reductase